MSMKANLLDDSIGRYLVLSLRDQQRLIFERGEPNRTNRHCLGGQLLEFDLVGAHGRVVGSSRCHADEQFAEVAPLQESDEGLGRSFQPVDYIFPIL
jgi:hypothetical protein